MGKQFDRLSSEQLKEYYFKTFEEYRLSNYVILELISARERFVIKLYDKLTEKNEKININLIDHGQRSALEGEGRKVFEERNIVREEYSKKSKELCGGGNLTLDRIKSEALENKLSLIEDELNNLGVFIKMSDGRVVFEERKLESGTKGTG